MLCKRQRGVQFSIVVIKGPPPSPPLIPKKTILNSPNKMRNNSVAPPSSERMEPRFSSRQTELSPPSEDIEETLQDDISFHPILLKFKSKRWEKLYQIKKNMLRRKCYPFLLAYFLIEAILWGLENISLLSIWFFICYFGFVCMILTLGIISLQSQFFQSKTEHFTLCFYIVCGIWVCIVETANIMATGLSCGFSSPVLESFNYCMPLLIGVFLDISFPAVLLFQLLFLTFYAISIFSMEGLQAHAKGLMCIHIVVNSLVTVLGTYALLRYGRHWFVDQALFKLEQLARYKDGMETKEHMISAKKKYIATIAHDIGTPISAFTICLEALKTMSTALLKEQREVVHMAECAVKLLQVVRKDALDYNTRAEGKAPQPSIGKVNIVELLINCSEVLNIAGSYSDLPVKIFRERRLPIAIEGDGEWLWSMVLVLLSNARKYGVTGVIKVYIFLVQAGDQIRIEVADEGMGVPHEKRHRLFKPFSKAHRNDMGGLGLGLHSMYVKALQLGGTVGMRDNPWSKRGSIFWFQIPCSQGAVKREVRRQSTFIDLTKSGNSEVREDSGLQSVDPAFNSSLSGSYSASHPSAHKVLFLGMWNFHLLKTTLEFCSKSNFQVEEYISFDKLLHALAAEICGIVFWLVEELDNDILAKAQQLVDHLHSNPESIRSTTHVVICVKQYFGKCYYQPTPSILEIEENQEDKTDNDIENSPANFKSHPLRTRKKKPKGKSRKGYILPPKSSSSEDASHKGSYLKKAEKEIISFFRTESEQMANKKEKDTFFPKVPHMQSSSKSVLPGFEDTAFPSVLGRGSKRSGPSAQDERSLASLRSASHTSGYPFPDNIEIINKPFCDADLIIAIMCCGAYKQMHVVCFEDHLLEDTLVELYTANSGDGKQTLIPRERGLKSMCREAFGTLSSVEEMDGQHNTQSTFKKQELYVNLQELESPMDVLMVEDDKITVKMTGRLLTKAKYSVDVAENGKIGLQKMKDRLYSFVLMDWNMPVMDGLESIQRFRKWESTEINECKREKKQKIVMFSANAAEDYIAKAIEGGADAFIAKPVKIKELLDTVSSISS